VHRCSMSKQSATSDATTENPALTSVTSLLVRVLSAAMAASSMGIATDNSASHSSLRQGHPEQPLTDLKLIQASEEEEDEKEETKEKEPVMEEEEDEEQEEEVVKEEEDEEVVKEEKEDTP